LKDQQTTVSQLKDMVQSFVDERDWKQFHNPKNLSMSIAIETAELMEHFQWQRTEELEALKSDETVMAEVREEIADIFCYTLSFATTMGIDLAEALADKMKKNAIKYPAQRFKGRFK